MLLYVQKNMANFYEILFCVVALTIPNTSCLSKLRVKTQSGQVEGFLGKTCRDQTPFAGFRGIPYAEPPVGKLRFRDPVPKKSWTNVWDATFQRPSCMQGSLDSADTMFPGNNSFSEDCLYLNVYTPNVKYFENWFTPLKAVMVFIHMGAFVMGSSSESAISPDFLLDQDVVVVTFNYRLGALGFLTLQNSNVPGNAGLKDQNLALKWVKKNINAFGGDPNKITIFGESAGSASVNYHILSPSSSGLFKSAIMQSGTAIAPWAFSPPDLALTKSLNLAKKVSCGQDNMDEVLECMQKVPAELIRDLQQKALTLEEIFSLRIIAFHPTVEPEVPGAFITVSPFELLFSGNFTKVPTIIGSTSDEGLLLYPALTKKDPYGFLLTLVGMDLSRFAPYNFHLKPFTKLAVEVHQQISKFYFNSKLITKFSLLKVLELLTDTMFVLPIQLTASLMADYSTPVYNYVFTYDGTYGLGKAASNIMDVPGVCHGDEVGYIFYVPPLHKNCGRNVSEAASIDELTINRMTKMWTNFAKTGNPTPKNNDNEVPVTWNLFTSTKRSYLDIGKDLVPGDSFKLANMMFWESLIRKLIAATEDKSIQKEDVYEF